jgi:uncharacterized Tic20 family protein
MTDSIPSADNPSTPQPPPRVIEVTAHVVQSTPGPGAYQMPPSSSAAGPAAAGAASGAAASAPPPSSPPPPPPSAPPFTPSATPLAPRPDGHGWATLCHAIALVDFGFHFLCLGLIATLVVWLIKKDEDPEVDWHGKESLNFQISLLLWYLAALALCCCLIGIPILAALPIIKIVLMIYAAVRAANGERWQYPLTLRLIT